MVSRRIVIPPVVACFLATPLERNLGSWADAKRVNLIMQDGFVLGLVFIAAVNRITMLV